MSQKWSYNNQEFEVDLQDAEFAERYEKAFASMEEDEKNVLKAGSNSGIIRSYCLLYIHLFDAIYGEGTSDKLFEGKVNARLCEEAYGAFMDAATRDARQAAQKRGELRNRYAPRQNREQRRNQHGQSKGGRQ